MEKRNIRLMNSKVSNYLKKTFHIFLHHNIQEKHYWWIEE
ncbi:hypothetical protein BD31_I1715 [Candidatus Nitrosopumilus salaria BD31]|uniref:Uncharacterized protein n=1 Tax=Candidatus Nitrosopumilus salarius BD31 TaxID=859350 RepID=I3D1I5_9ARCH|nr:hypothetical protein BD31_I1715 [Candidatus Nitrosopumilus salaria BD31]